MMLLIALPLAAAADVAEDFENGRKAFDRGDISGSMAPLRRAADAGHAKAQALYAYVLDISEFDAEALAYYQKSADQADPDGQYGVAQMYISGEAGKRDYKLARTWLEKAAAQGQGQAVMALAEAYLSGGLGMEQAELESPEALRWLNAAADLKSLTALTALQAAYANGKYGLTADPVKAAEIEARIKILKPDEPTKKKRRKG